MENNSFLSLSDIPTGKKCVVIKVHGHGSFRNRIVEMGFVRGETVTVVKNAPLRDPIEYALMDFHISLRRSEANLIEVVSEEDRPKEVNNYNGIQADVDPQNLIHSLNAYECARTINVALVGNPNCGKTSFFNRASGMREHVGNYSGVTVDAKKATFRHNDYTINLIDLPGTYSITEYTPEELYVRKYISEQNPDIVLNVVDATNLERNLFLTTQLIDMNIRVVMALNIYDELQKQGATLDYKQLGIMFGFPIIPTSASKGEGISKVLDTLIEVYEDKNEYSRHIHINYGPEIESSIQQIKECIVPNKSITDRFSSRYLSIKMIEKDKITYGLLSETSNADEIVRVTERNINNLVREFKEDTQTIITNAKYGFIRGALKETYTEGSKDSRYLTTAIDTILTHPWLGFPILLLFMWVMFQTTFTLGEYPMDWIESGIEGLRTLVANILPQGALNDMMVDGIIAGVGGVAVFLPNILILFFFISLMEDTGYMARAAFIMDKLMHKIGLHGKSFIPLLIGFGCNVPAIMATRTLENRRERLMTMLITPFISCSARMPVYILFIQAFFSVNQGFVLLSIYLIGIIFAILSALLLKKTVFHKVSEPFVMELPPYRMPTMRNTLTHMWGKAKEYLKKMSTIILFASILIWAAGYYPHKGQAENAKQLEESYIGRIGKTIEPVIAPLGFNWQMGVSIISGCAAKEIVVSTIGILYNCDTEEESTNALSNALKDNITPLQAFSFMIFVLLYFPCIAVLAAIRKEAGKHWVLFTVFYNTGVAWLTAFLVYQIGSLF